MSHPEPGLESHRELIVATASPRRIELLRTLGVEFRAQAADVDETPLPGEAADAMVLRLAALKALAIGSGDRQIVLGADTAVVLDGEIFGKPRDRADALRMLGRLSGRSHEVKSAVAVHCRGAVRSALSCTRVRFREIRPDEALRYWHSGEPRDKAGAYAIQGLGGVFVESISGSYTGVVGLPLFETAELLREAGLDLLPSMPG